MAVLIGMSAEVKGKSFSIDRSPLTIGKASDNVLPVDVVGVSGHHCSITTEGDKFTLTDLGSTNGTRVNNKDVTAPTVLKPKDLIQVGTVEFLFNVEGASIEDLSTDDYPKTEVVVSEGPAVQPQGFDSISPFGARRREPTGRMTAFLIVLGIIAALGVVFALYKMLKG